MEANDAFKTNLKAVKELILDEHKLVSYISLSNELCIHVNEAKYLLYQIIQDIRKAQPEIDLSISYVISGLLNNNSGCTTVCSETDFSTLKKTLKIVFYEHVYSVSRGLKSVDNVALAAINKFEDLVLCTGIIKANSCTKRTDDEIGNLKSKNLVPIVPMISIVQQKDIKDKGQQVIKYHLNDAKKSNEVKLEPKVKSEILSPKKNVSNNNKTSAKTSGNKTAKKGIAGFFSKVNSDSSKALSSNVKKAEVQEPLIKVEKDITVEPTSTDSNIPSNAAKNTSIINTKSKASKNNSHTQIKNNAKVDKKRKRLLRVSDSESETEENDPFTNKMDVDHESEDEIPPTPTVNTVKITSGIVNPKKRRKIVDKTYTDEDGYILTKKEEVYESFSENEEEAKENSKSEKENDIHDKGNIKKTKENTEQMKIIKTETSPKENKSKKKKVSPPQKGKQSTINSFFKKA